MKETKVKEYCSYLTEKYEIDSDLGHQVFLISEVTQNKRYMVKQ